MIKEVGVSFIPISPFYANENVKNLKDKKGIYYVRVALCRKPETMLKALDLFKLIK